MSVNNGKVNVYDTSHNHDNFSEATEKPENTIFKSPSSPRPAKFDQPLILLQSNHWLQAILWILMGVITGIAIWANFARIEEAISAQGKLEATSDTKPVQVPINGVVKEVFAKDGQKVKVGEKLLSLDSTTAMDQFASLKKIRASLVQENEFYNSQIQGKENFDIASLKISDKILNLAKKRATLIIENKLYRTQINGTSPNRLSLEQQERFLSNQAELNARLNILRFDIEQLKNQLNEIDIRLSTAKESLAMNQGIINNLQPLVQTGAISKIYFLKQEEEARNSRSQIQQLIQEKQRIKSSIVQTAAKLKSTILTSHNDLINQIAINDKQIAEIDSQFTKNIVENNKRIAEIDSEISQVKTNLKYQDIKAPVNGTIFQLKTNTPGFVVTSTEPIVKIVPDDALVAQVYITNKDIGFVKEGMNVDVRIDSFPYSEFGDIKGKLIWIGSDVLSPDETNHFYRFPAKIRLDKQSILVHGRNVSLQSGMSVSANIKLRDRTVMSIFTDMFSENLESFKFLR